MYKLVDALEEVSDFWMYGKDLTTMPSYNVYVPPRHHILPKPNLNDEKDDEVSLRYNMSRLSAHHYHNPLKSKKFNLFIT